jgi:hypothetical protein
MRSVVKLMHFEMSCGKASVMRVQFAHSYINLFFLSSEENEDG